MKARPILFNGAMVRAILEGRKTQTRRIARPEEFGASTWASLPDDLADAWRRSARPRHPRFGERGDRMWVRETWGLHAYGDETDWFRGSVRGAHANSLQAQYHLTYRADWGPAQEGCFWRPSIHLPRWASRLTLEVTDVRAQRLQDISEKDAQAEGCRGVRGPVGQMIPGPPLTAVAAFERLWNSINGKRASWASNPLVWAVSFRRLP